MALIINHITSSSFTLLFLLTLLWLTNTSEYHYTQDGCQEWCGNVRIPFPFGIGVNCYLNEWHSIECRNSSRISDYYMEGTPYLTNISLEVLDISLDSNLVEVNHPVISPNCPVINNGSSSVNLTNSPFQFSAYYNLFVAVGVGCDNQEAMMLTDLLDNNKKMPITQCTLTCNSSTNNINISSCTSRFYVQSLQGYNVNLASIGNNNNQTTDMGSWQKILQIWSIISIYWFSIGVQNKTTAHVPVRLDWIFPAWITLVPTPASDKYRRCFPSSNAFSSSKGRCEIVEGWTCYCKFSSGGNPYLPDGCKVGCSEAPWLPWCNKSKIIIIGVCAGSGGLLFLLAAFW